jgi:osmotically-inducible protein OsmY
MSPELVQSAETSALELKRRVTLFLSQKGVSPDRRLNIEVADGTVTFRGTVASFYQRQLCLACVHLPGVRKVVDGLQVDTRSPASVDALW